MTLKKALSIGNIVLLIGALKAINLAYASTPSEFRKYAEILLIKNGIEPISHTVLVSNCSYIMRNFIDLNEIPNLQDITKSEIQKFFFSKSFWGQKLQREISIPYSDIEFRKFVSNLQQEVNGLIKYLHLVNSSSSEFDLKIFGSMAKARFGVNSSLDIIVHSSDHIFLSKVEQGIYSESHPKFRGNIKLITSNNESYFLLDPFYTVTTGELSNLAKIYQDILETKNLRVKQTEQDFNITLTKLPTKFNLEFNAIEDRMFFLLNELKQLENSLRNSTEVFVPNNKINQNKMKLDYLDKMQSLSQDLTKVKNDIKLIIEQKNNARHDKIKTIVQPSSYTRLKGYRGRKMLDLMEQKLILIEKQTQVLR